MGGQNTDHGLAEYILALLERKRSEDKNAGSLEKESGQAVRETSFGREDVWSAKNIMAFMDEMPGGFLIYHADQEEKIIYANKALLRIFQCESLEEFRALTRDSFRGIVYAEDLDSIEQSIQEQIADSQYNLDYVEYRIVQKDGSVRWVEDYGHFVHSESVGDIFYVFISDATDKIVGHLMEKSALEMERVEKDRLIQSMVEEYDKERRRINQENLRRLEVIEGLSINYASILYADLDKDTVLPYRLSSRTELQFDKKLEPRSFRWYTKDYVNTWVHPEDKKRVAKATDLDYIRKKLEKHKTYYVNYRAIKDGKTQYLQLRIVNVGEQKGVSQIVMGYRKVDKEVRREMQQKQMVEDALRNANMAITAKNTFLSNMSHDMRTPLNAIFGYTELAERHIDEKEAVQEYLRKIERSGKTLLDLIEKVLKISWTEADDIQIKESGCNLCELMWEVQRPLQHTAEEKNIEFSLDFSELRHGDVYCDYEKLKQILSYLVDNAVMYTENNGRVDLSVREVEQLPNDYAIYEFRVKDNGIGIGEDFLAHVFEPFEREKNTTFSGIYGTGLGLSIAKSIVEKMGGRIEVSSEAGVGSVFTVTLSFQIQDTPQTAEIDTEAVLGRILAKKILLVDDNEINLEIETELLGELGFLVETANDGSIAIERIKSAGHGEYALVLMDIQMPVMDGRKATAAIRELEDARLAHIPIIALSADAFESDKRKSIECGMDEHLPKPIDLPLLLETMARVVWNYEMIYGKIE